MAVTLKDVAARARMDVSTVSRVLNDKGAAYTSPETRRRIHAIARQLGYRTHLQARSLRRGRSNMIGVLIRDFDNPTYAEYLHHIDEHLTDQGLQMVPMSSKGSPGRYRQCLEMLSGRMVDGAIILDYEPANTDDCRRLQEAGLPLVLRAPANLVEEAPCPCVGIDLADSWSQLTHHLLQQGYRRLGVLGNFQNTDLHETEGLHPNLQGFVQAHREFGLLPDATRIIRPLEDPLRTSDHLIDVLRDRPGAFDSLVVRSSQHLLGTVRALTVLQRRVGSDVGLASFDNTDAARLLPVPVTLSGQPIHRVSEALVRILLRSLENPGGPVPKQHYASRMIIRESTAGPEPPSDGPAEGSMPRGARGSA